MVQRSSSMSRDGREIGDGGIAQLEDVALADAGGEGHVTQSPACRVGEGAQRRGAVRGANRRRAGDGDRVAAGEVPEPRRAGFELDRLARRGGVESGLEIGAGGEGDHAASIATM
jgi:hypothetical protein